MPSVFSADIFVKEFPSVAGNHPRCLFIRGEKAKSTLKDGLPFKLKEWTVYETIERHDQTPVIVNCIQQHQNVTVILLVLQQLTYARDVVPHIGWHAARIAAIGHITEAALEQYGATVDIMPSVYTMQAVIEEIMKVGDKS